MNIKKIIKGLVISLLSLGVGYFAIAVPFNLISTLSPQSVRLIFCVELGIYLLVGAICIIFLDKKQAREKKEKARKIERLEKRKQAQKEYYSLAA